MSEPLGFLNWAMLLIDTHWVPIVALFQATFCGGIAFTIGFKYQRRGSKYRLLPSICAAGLASLFAQQWLSIVGRILMYSEWPVVSVYNTLIFGILFLLIARSSGNVAQMFNFEDKKQIHA